MLNLVIEIIVLSFLKELSVCIEVGVTFFFLCKGYQELLDQISNSGTNFQSFNFLVSLHRWPSLSSQICLGCYSYQLFFYPSYCQNLN